MNDIAIISPEGLDIAEAYLRNGSSAEKTAIALSIPLSEVTRHLNTREVKVFIDQVYFESGFRNRERMGNLMDEILAAKLEEMDETGLGSSKDILEIMKLAHDMKMKEMEMQIKMDAAKTPGLVVNQQNNYGGRNYNTLLERIMNAGSK